MRPQRSVMLAVMMLTQLVPSAGLAQVTAEATAAPRVWSGNERGRVEALIALRELSRIALEGGRLAALIDYKQALHARKDETTGQFFIAPREDGAKPINVFAIDEAGSTYALLLHPRDLPAQSVILKPVASVSSPRRAPSLARAIKDIVIRLAGPRHLEDSRVSRANEPIELWEEARLLMTATLDAGDLLGERYLLTNLTIAELRVREEELYRDGVVAVSIREHVLPPAGSTVLIVVREKATRP